MLLCPVCEHAQEGGDECAVCGQRLEPSPLSPPEVAALEGLEPTHFDGVEGEGERLLDLEPTGFDPAPEAPAVPVELEPARAEAVSAAVTPLDDLEPTRSLPLPDDPASAPAPPACRYCRTPVPPTDAFCPRCGMRLARSAAPRPASAAPAAVCSSCGTPSTGDVCRACGARRSR